MKNCLQNNIKIHVDKKFTSCLVILLWYKTTAQAYLFENARILNWKIYEYTTCPLIVSHNIQLYSNKCSQEVVKY